MPAKTAEREPRSTRGKRLRGLAVVTPLDQIRVTGATAGVDATGAYAYYINPEGATIRDALVLYPNGGIPDLDDERLRARYGTNAEYYRSRQARKGLIYVGQTLTAGGIRQLIEVIERNRPDEILFVEDEIADAEEVAKNSDQPEYRAQAKRRIQQLRRRLEYLTQELDADALEAELNEIARAQQLARVDPNVLRVMRSMIGDVNANLAAMVGKFQSGKAPTEPGAPKLRAGGSSRGSEFEGASHLDG